MKIISSAAMLKQRIPDSVPFDPSIRRYKICDLHREGMIVWMTAHDSEFFGFLKFTRSGQRRYRMRIDRNNSVDLPQHFQPSLWRPIRPDLWGPLPEPADQTKLPEPAVYVASEPELVLPECDYWPYPEIRLGRPHERPESAKEAEARVLRGLRTADALMRDRHRSEAAWPPALLIKAKLVEKLLRASRTRKLVHFRDQDYDDIFIDQSDLRALPARFQPTRRDVSDFEAGCLAWLMVVPRPDRLIFQMRADLPSYSWRQIAEADDAAVEEIHERYDAGVQAIFRESTR